MAYQRTTWKDSPDETTPISADNLNNIEQGIVDLDNGKLDKSGDASNISVTFTVSSTRTAIASGTKLNVIMGRIAKFLADLKSVAFTGSYNDLSNKPSLKTVATSGSYNDLSNRPTLSKVATSGSYGDLNNKPTIPAVVNSLTATVAGSVLDATQGKLLKDSIDSNKTTAHNEMLSVVKVVASAEVQTTIPSNNPLGVNYTINVPTGYTLVGVVEVGSRGGVFYLHRFSVLSANMIQVDWKNPSSSSQTKGTWVKALCIRNS